MSNDQEHIRPRIMLIDRQRSWLERSVLALRSAGFEVDFLDHYDYPPPYARPDKDHSTLVILGSASIGPEEFRLIERVHQNGDHLLVLSTSLPWSIMRKVFLGGADDVTNKPYDPKSLVSIVHQVVSSISPAQ
jgi:DNA-binding response OmpR family regulator